MLMGGVKRVYKGYHLWSIALCGLVHLKEPSLMIPHNTQVMKSCILVWYNQTIFVLVYNHVKTYYNNNNL